METKSLDERLVQNSKDLAQLMGKVDRGEIEQKSKEYKDLQKKLFKETRELQEEYKKSWKKK